MSSTSYLAHLLLAMGLILMSYIARAQEIDTSYRTSDAFKNLSEEEKEELRIHDVGSAGFKMFLKRKADAGLKHGTADNDIFVNPSHLPLRTNYCSDFNITSSSQHDTAILFQRGFRGYHGENKKVNEVDQFDYFRREWQAGKYDVNFDPNATDNNIGCRVIPPGENYSIKLGNNVNGHGTRSGLAYKLQVNNSNKYIQYSYIYFLINAGHGETDQPFFKFRILNEQGQVMQNCNNFTYLGGQERRNDWVRNFIDLSSFVGQTVILYFETGGCYYRRTDHWGYAYIHLKCASPVLDLPGKVCQQSPFLLGRPAIFDNFSGFTYNWTVNTATSNYAVTTSGGNDYLNIFQPGNYTVTLTITKGTCSYPFTHNITVEDCISLGMPESACTNEPVDITSVIHNKTTNTNYTTKWEFPPDAHWYKKDGREYVIFCNSGVKDFKVTFTFNNGGQNTYRGSISIKNCDIPYTAPEKACPGQAILLDHPIFRAPDFSEYTHSWKISGLHTISTNADGKSYVTFPYPGQYNIEFTLVRQVNNCEKRSSANITVNVCDAKFECCESSFAPDPGNYHFAGWVNADKSITDPAKLPYYQLKVKYADGSIKDFNFTPTLNTDIEGWSLAQGVLDLQYGVVYIQVNFINPSSFAANFDDIRMQPFNASMKGYVFDNETKRMIAELDDNNYATFYEYDEEGNLIRVKKETERGVMTIKESRVNMIKQ